MPEETIKTNKNVEIEKQYQSVDKDMDSALKNNGIEEIKIEKTDNRKLGDEWENWDGKTGYGCLEAPKSLFLSFCFLLVFVNNVILYGAFYLMYPRLYSWHYSVPVIILSIVSIYSLSLSPLSYIPNVNCSFSLFLSISSYIYLI